MRQKQHTKAAKTDEIAQENEQLSSRPPNCKTSIRGFESHPRLQTLQIMHITTTFG